MFYFCRYFIACKDILDVALSTKIIAQLLIDCECPVLMTSDEKSAVDPKTQMTVFAIVPCQGNVDVRMAHGLVPRRGAIVHYSRSSQVRIQGIMTAQKYVYDTLWPVIFLFLGKGAAR
ncbi:hypothetical protein TNCV_4494191 [Trichonephila clavipes]|nr:hypothetical protein TNCV_4494191 [Trichonephila clavipes]